MVMPVASWSTGAQGDLRQRSHVSDWWTLYLCRVTSPFFWLCSVAPHTEKEPGTPSCRAPMSWWPGMTCGGLQQVRQQVEEVGG